ncbi:MAG: MoxR family ATPase [Candidatus Dormibacteraeota bacterium]|uniref:MoxR family ATPase n=1 Tax=Candidatus Amunia macphersoniae TaxID=3127014 RepID=A0A934NF10_9BACT|nr:MoxR family ATPase [Candidatus Dormibacteraeota bacterium]
MSIAPAAVDTITPEDFAATAIRLETELHRLIVGQREVVRDTVIALLAGGHVLLEGVPGLGKTSLVRAIGDTCALQFSRIQFTPDLMPADITGTMIISEHEGSRGFTFQHGPVFANVVLADEVNRATPKTQSALLEAMQERSVTVAGTTRPLPDPFFVLATQNPIELEGTYPLPEAQLDRFLVKLLVPFPTTSELAEIARRTTGAQLPRLENVVGREVLRAMIGLAREVLVADHVLDYAARLVAASHPRGGAPAEVTAQVRFGASPRAVQGLVQMAKVRALLEGRFNVAFEDVRSFAAQVLRHRLLLTFEAETEGITPDSVVSRILDAVDPEPVVS